MKKEYFSEDNIREEAKLISDAIFSCSRAESNDFELGKSALIIADMQKYFLSESSHAFVPSAKAIVANIISLADHFSAHGRPVFTTKHINTRENSGMMGKWWKEIISEENPLSELIDEIALLHERTIVKDQYDAFLNTGLEGHLRRLGVENVVVCGVMTHLCVESSARSAFMHGFGVFLPLDATATYNIEYHKASALNLSHGFATVCLSEDLIKVKYDYA